MARTIAKRTRSKTPRSSATTVTRFWETPAAKYALGGIGLIVLGRIAYSLYRKYPQIGEYIQEGFDSVEDRLRTIRTSADEDFSESVETY